MPVRSINGLQYYLVLVDEDGRERAETDGSQMSEIIRQRVADPARPVTDVFITSHGWKGDIPGAIQQYDRWIGAMAEVRGDIEKVKARRAGFTPVIIGLHWPSLPWGMEDEKAQDAQALLGPGAAPTRNEDEGVIVRQLSQGLPPERAMQVTQSVRTILDYAKSMPQGAPKDALPSAIEAAYERLYGASGLHSGNLGGRPGADHDNFDAGVIAQQAGTLSSGDGPVAGLLGLRDIVLSPLRQLSFWKMKDRARSFGESGAHSMLISLQDAAPRARFHLMGHSFGSIVVSAMVAGSGGGGAPVLRRPVDTLFLVQGALSLWAYAADIPYAPGTAGYFRRIVERGLVRGPIVTTRSRFDTAVGRLYPLGARLKGQFVLGDSYPEYGGIGAFGIRGDDGALDSVIQAVSDSYRFQCGTIHNIEASRIICNGDGASGAHSDIAHPEVAHLFWEAVLASAEAATLVMPAGGPGAFLGTITPPADPKGAPGLGGVMTDPFQSYQPAAPDSGLLGGAGLPQSAPPPRSAGAASPGGAAPAASAESDAARAPASDPRYINASFEELGPTEPLYKGNWYTLAFNVDVEQSGELASAQLAVPTETLFPAGVEQIALTVQLESTDFDVSGNTAVMRVTKTGPSRTKARFDLSPFHDGPCRLTAIISKDGNFVQQIDLTIVVGQTRVASAVSSRGRRLTASAALQPRDLMFLISPSSGGYDCVVCGPVAMRARLPITAAFIDDAIKVAREALMTVVLQQDANGRYSFQSGVDIPRDQLDIALGVMARAGASLLKKLFEGPAAGPDSKAIAALLRKLGGDRDRPLKLQIVAESMPVPWGMLYLGSVAQGIALDWSNFLGMRHIVEQIPLQEPMITVDNTICSDQPCLNVGVNFNDTIDAQMGMPFVVTQRQYWSGLPPARVKVSARSTWTELMQALNDGETPQHIIYFYCHAESRGLAERGGPYASSIALTDAARTLTDITLDAGTEVQLAGSPLVFINACESAEMSPAFYDGFAPYFMSKGARGVIGTECRMPALFAAEWAGAFFTRFLQGNALGRTFLDLRCKFLNEHNNPLGLLYAVHCDADTRVAPMVP
ncbi:CHAT domain-containing protein [Paraburkholderia fungorum]|uniref:CHAT domain-containing protein n=1 Tax=Paraburkholderia fungorum TaxID=134537 RepID=UPI0038BAAA32